MSASDDNIVLFRRAPAELNRRNLQRFAQTLRDAVAKDRAFTCLITGDSHIRRLNRDFLGKDYPTDVLSFPAVGQASRPVLGHLGEMAISAARARTQAAGPRFLLAIHYRARETWSAGGRHPTEGYGSTGAVDRHPTRHLAKIQSEDGQAADPGNAGRGRSGGSGERDDRGTAAADDYLGAGAADRLREYRESAAGARRGHTFGDGDSGGVGRSALQAPAADPYGERAAGDFRRRGRPRGGVRRHAHDPAGFLPRVALRPHQRQQH